MFNHRNRIRTAAIASIVVAVVCAEPWIDSAAAQRVSTVQEADLVLVRYEFKHSSPDQIRSMLRALLGQSYIGRVALDDRTNTLLIYAPQPTHDKIRNIVIQLDVPATATQRKQVARSRGGGRGGGQPAVPVELRVLWLASGPPADKSKDLPEDLKPVADALAKKGVKDLRLVGQTMINTRSNSSFGAVASPMLGRNVVELTVKGMVTRISESFSVSIRVDAKSAARLANLDTTINAKPGEYMVLGLVPVQGITSVFVVQANLIE